MQTIDDQLIDQNSGNNKYGSFWRRTGAMLLDGLLLSPLTVGVTFLAMLKWKSLPVLILINLIGVAYKPVCEFLYGRTLGKKWLGLKVINEGDAVKPSVGTAIIRNLFFIAPSVFSLISSMLLFSSPGFEDITGYTEYTQFAALNAKLSWLQFVFGILILIDAIVLGTDKQKRSIHDKIASTLVVKD